MRPPPLAARLAAALRARPPVDRATQARPLFIGMK